MKYSDDLGSFAETNGVVAQVIDRVVLPQEGIAQDGQGTNGFGEVHAHEGRNAGALDFEDVIERRDGEVVTSESEGEIREDVALLALDRVLSVPALLGTNLGVQELGDGGGKRDPTVVSTGLADYTGEELTEKYQCRQWHQCC